MKKRIVIVHGWASGPDKIWFPWLRAQLEQKGFEVVIPAMPTPFEPKIDAWVAAFGNVVAASSEPTVVIAHSVGCQTVLRYAATHERQLIGAVFVTPWYFALTGLEKDEQGIATPWLATAINFAAARKSLGTTVAIYSDNDPYVPLEENKQGFEKELGSRSVVLHGGGHFDADDGVTELPAVLEALKLVILQ